MTENEQKDEDKNNKPVNNYIKFSGIAFQMVAIIGITTFVGYKIDEHAKHSTQWVTAVLALFGVFISLYLVIKSLKD
jgi:F0F1-type ATP synthase assembly protein I